MSLKYELSCVGSDVWACCENPTCLWVHRSDDLVRVRRLDVMPLVCVHPGRDDIVSVCILDVTSCVCVFVLRLDLIPILCAHTGRDDIVSVCILDVMIVCAGCIGR